MIVKDEEDVICRCLDSVKPLIDYVYITDTGSKDNTINKIKEWLNLNKIEGEVFQEKWVDFAHNRSISLKNLRQNIDVDYVLTIDADEILLYDKNINIIEIKNNLNKDLYSIICKYGNIEYTRNCIFRNNMEFYYRGVLHEFLDCKQPIRTRGTINGIYNRPIQDSTRNKNPEKYKKDALVLEGAIKEEKDAYLLSRYSFYLAQSYRDMGDDNKAFFYYNKRIELKGWAEEVWYSYYMASSILLRRGDIEKAEEYAIKGFISYPYRSENIYLLLKYYRVNKDYSKAYSYYLLGKDIKKHNNQLFIEHEIYDYGFDFEFSIINYYLDNLNKEDGKKAALKVLDSNASEQIKALTKNNLLYYNNV